MTHNNTSCGSSNAVGDPFDFEAKGTLILYFVGMIYMFFAIHMVCDEYFVASIHAIVERCGCDEDVAGATLMAAASSAPELFAGIVGVFVSGSEDVGIGTVVGSCVFNMCVIVGGVALAYPHDTAGPLRLGGFSLVRDSVFYVLSVVLLLVIFEDGKATPGESVSLFLMYLVYVGISYNFRRIKEAARTWMSDRAWCCDGHVFDPVDEEASKQRERESEMVEKKKTTTKTQTMENGEVRDPVAATVRKKKKEEEEKTPWHVTVTGFFLGSTKEEEEEGDVSASTLVCCPSFESKESSDRTLARRVMWYVQLPIRWIFMWTIPDCRLEHRKEWYPGTFACALAWLGVLVFLMLEWAKKAGCLAGISSATMGLTFCAAGTSAPDCFISLIVARGGRGKMAVSNVFGSNIFDVLLCLGLPLTLSAIAHAGDDTVVGKDGIVESVVILLLLLVIIVGSVVPTKLVLKKVVGPVLIAIYLGYLLFVFVDNEA